MVGYPVLGNISTEDRTAPDGITSSAALSFQMIHSDKDWVEIISRSFTSSFVKSCVRLSASAICHNLGDNQGRRKNVRIPVETVRHLLGTLPEILWAGVSIRPNIPRVSFL